MPLLGEVRSTYERDGYAVVKEFLPDSLIRELREETDRYVTSARESNLVGTNFDIIETPNGPDLRRIANPERVSEVYDRAMRWKPLVDLDPPYRDATRLDGESRCQKPAVAPL
ncbi:hypothetical protein KHP62_15615 [Rhodobacteraceae bacterium NNCM2]|nr:hypothetical protein [Coraliihabitans acroporae]